MNMSGLTSGDSKYRFGGKEYQDEVGLLWYDFSARNYDAQLGRWFNIDPMAENYFSYSPYNYCINNPICLSDPNGAEVTVNDDGVLYTGADAVALYYYLLYTKPSSVHVSCEAVNEVGGGFCRYLRFMFSTFGLRL